MIQTYSLFTSEIDYPQLALQQVQGQLEGLRLLKNSVGIVACHYDFIEGGVLEALAEALPFPLVGTTTFYQQVPGASGLFKLSITVLTSDDVCFSVGHCSGPDDGQPTARRIERVYKAALAGCGGAAPGLVLNFLSLNRPVSGDEYLRLLDEASGGVPAFGSVTTGDDESGAHIYVICGGEVFAEGFALLLLAGPVQPRFYFGNFCENSMLEIRASVTGTEGTVVKQLAGQPAVDFLRTNGVQLEDGEQNAVSTVPYLIHRPGDEVVIARTLAGFNDEGEMHFMGEVPEGAVFHVGTVTADGLLQASRMVARQAVDENPDAALLLMYSCVGRFITLGLDTTAEMDYATAVVPRGMNFCASYAAGEICPVPAAGGLANRYHNSSFIVCALR